MLLFNRTSKNVSRVYVWASFVHLQNRHGVTNEFGDRLVIPLQVPAQGHVIAAVGIYDRCKRGSQKPAKTICLTNANESTNRDFSIGKLN